MRFTGVLEPAGLESYVSFCSACIKSVEAIELDAPGMSQNTRQNTAIKAA